MKRFWAVAVAAAVLFALAVMTHGPLAPRGASAARPYEGTTIRAVVNAEPAP